MDARATVQKGRGAHMGVRRGASSHPRPLIIARAGLERASRRRRAGISRHVITTIKNYNLHRRPSGGSVSFGDDESSTVSSTLPPPSNLISFFVTYRRSGGAHPTHKIRFWRGGQGWSWGTCLCDTRSATPGAASSERSDCVKGLGECRIWSSPLGIGFQVSFFWSSSAPLLSETLLYMPEHRS